jgi:hypothetical protein
MCCGTDQFRVTPEGVLQYRVNNQWVSVSNFAPATAQGINAETVQNVILTQVPNGEESFLPSRLVVAVEELTAYVSNATVSVGITGPNYDDIIPATALTVNAEGEYEFIDVTPGVVVPAGSIIYLRISTGASAGTYLINASLEGTYVRL